MKEKGTLLFCIIPVLMLLMGFVFNFGISLPLQANENEVTGFPPQEDIETQIKAIMKEGRIPGAGIVLIKGDKHVVVKGYGYADPETQTPVTADTLFELGSCSKSFTALAVLQLAKDGWVKLDDPVSKYFPWFEVYYRGKAYKITINQLLHHIGGIPWRTFAGIQQDNSADALKTVVRDVSGIELLQVPGRQFIYSNTNYDIIGAIIEQASGMKFEEYMAKKIFAPLGMSHTFVGFIPCFYTD
jgi:putative ATP-binding cassette transporter